MTRFYAEAASARDEKALSNCGNELDTRTAFSAPDENDRRALWTKVPPPPLLDGSKGVFPDVTIGKFECD